MTGRTLQTTVPVSLLTGFLGAGKTTLLNRVLTESHGQRIAVIVNEFGEVGIDGSLVEDVAGDVIELANGCLCCATRGQLLDAIGSVTKQAETLDGILIETSGLADPFPVLSELAHSSLTEILHIDGVITLVDAENFDRNLDSAEAAFHQIEAADLLLINKIDLVAAEIPAMIEAGIRRLNPAARVATCAGAKVPLAMLLGSRVTTASQERVESVFTEGTVARGAHEHEHDGFESLVLRPHAALDSTRLSAWLSSLPPTVFRVKGLVHLADKTGQATISAVGTRHSFGAARSNVDGDRVVVIGQGLDPASLTAGLAACHA